MAVQTLKHDHPEMAGRIHAVRFPAHSDKRVRAQVLAERLKRRRVIIQRTDITDVWIQEHTEFPAEHDDCVDVCSVATHWFGLQHEFSAAIAAMDAQKRREQEYNALVAQTMARIGANL
jgi:phage terminase large subunit-like protein